jgi:hypothetical protein
MHFWGNPFSFKSISYDEKNLKDKEERKKDYNSSYNLATSLATSRVELFPPKS